MNLNLRNRNRTFVMDILYMQNNWGKKELLRLSLRLAQEFDVLNMRMASMLLPSHFPLLYLFILKNRIGQGGL